MVRLIVIQFLLVLAPFMLYAARLRSRGEPVFAAETWRDAPVLDLITIGLVAAGLAFAVFANGRDGSVEGAWRPSQMQNGVFVPGGTQPAP